VPAETGEFGFVPFFLGFEHYQRPVYYYNQCEFFFWGGWGMGKAYELMMNPVPPMTCGVQKIPSTKPWLLEMAFAMVGIAVNLFPVD
jgi:hypothetical protein